MAKIQIAHRDTGVFDLSVTGQRGDFDGGAGGRVPGAKHAV